jgi:hypothetical protein
VVRRSSVRFVEITSTWPAYFLSPPGEIITPLVDHGMLAQVTEFSVIIIGIAADRS